METSFNDFTIGGSMSKKRVIPVETYSRIVGYFRPVQNWNKGKQEEFKHRKEFKITQEGK